MLGTFCKGLHHFVKAYTTKYPIPNTRHHGIAAQGVISTSYSMEQGPRGHNKLRSILGLTRLPHSKQGEQSVIGVIKRSLGNDNRYAFSCLFKSLVRPILPPSEVPTKTRILGKVQRRASRLALKQKRGEMSSEDRCRLLNWQTLEKRREFLSLVQCYKIVFGIAFLFRTFLNLLNVIEPELITIISSM